MSHPGRLENKIALVTGGASGIGAAIVRKFLFEGAKVVIIFDLKAVDPEVKKDERVRHLEGDVTKEIDWERGVDVTLHEFGRLDVCVNCAGVVHGSMPSTQVSQEQYERVMKVNVSPLYLSAKYFQPAFARQDSGGVFVNLSSMSAPRPRPNLVWYAGSKGAVSAITKGLAAEFAKDKIRVNCVCPAATETDMVESLISGGEGAQNREALLKQIPLGRLGKPEDVANAVCWLASEEAGFVTGVELFVDGGRGLN